jgi:hypothetical protein
VMRLPSPMRETKDCLKPGTYSTVAGFIPKKWT